MQLVSGRILCGCNRELEADVNVLPQAVHPDLLATGDLYTLQAAGPLGKRGDTLIKAFMIGAPAAVPANAAAGIAAAQWWHHRET